MNLGFNALYYWFDFFFGVFVCSCVTCATCTTCAQGGGKEVIDDFVAYVTAALEKTR